MAETEEVDRISNLPDALLSEILSLLSTKEAVATSILSKRWEYIWTEVPVLDFSYSKDKISSNFTTFVNRVLILNDAPFIRLFRLHFYQEVDEDMHVWSWIMNTMRRDVLEIDVTCGTPEARGLVSEKLKVLKLRCPLTGSRLLYSFPILSILHLEFCYIEDHDSMNNIWSGLPCLNKFLLYHCHGLQNLRIQSSSLKRLTIAGTLFRMEGLVIIEAPSLEYLSIEDQVSCCEFDINIPSLVEADIDICGMIDGISAAEFLKHFHSMKTLNLMIPTPLAVMVDAQMQPLFPELTCLDVRTMYYLSQNLHIILLFQMCQHAPNLVSLKYKIESRTMEESPSLPNVVPKCFSSTLKAIDVDNFRGTFADNAVIEYILQHAIVLKVIRIHFEKNSTMAADAFHSYLKFLRPRLHVKLCVDLENFWTMLC